VDETLSVPTSSKPSSLTEQHQSSANRSVKFEFRGDGTEYFKIWIVNVLLTILTLGVYSAWAKVRNNRYLYSNLYLDDSNFRYLAQPITILKGRIIAVVALIIYTLLSQQYPMAAVGLSIALVIGIPYFIIQSLAFSHRMSAYKNIQFRFQASYGEAFMVLFIWPLLGMLSFGILYPLALLKLNKFIVNNSAYGTTKFEFSATYKDYGMIFLVAIGVAMVIGLPVLAIATMVPSLAFISPVFMVIVYLGLIVYFMVAFTNLYYRSTTLLNHRFSSSLTVPGMAKVILINAALTLITLGLYLPAAKVRMTKYVCSCLTMEADGSLDNFASAEKENISALGEEFGQVFDFGL